MVENHPDIYLFNPTCEMAMANGTIAWQPNRLLQQFEKDLDVIPAFLAQPSDIVIVHKKPSGSFCNRLKDAGIQTPEFISWEEIKTSDQFSNRPKRWLKPWGWSQVVHHQFRGMKESFSKSFLQSPVGQWNPEIKNLFSRLIAKEVLNELVDSEIDDLINNDVLPVVCKSTNEIVQHHRKCGKSILKAPWSSSGRGLQKVNFLAINESILNWCNGIIKNQGYIMHEPMLNKIMDFAFQFDIKADCVEYLGTSWFYTDEKGAYNGNYLEMPIDIIPAAFYNVFKLHEKEIAELLQCRLHERFIGKYIGFAGVDAMFVLQDNQPVIHPCVEINLRTNMGNIAMNLQKLTKLGYSKFEIGMVDQEPMHNTRQIVLNKVNANSKFCAYLK